MPPYTHRLSGRRWHKQNKAFHSSGRHISSCDDDRAGCGTAMGQHSLFRGFFGAELRAAYCLEQSIGLTVQPHNVPCSSRSPGWQVAHAQARAMSRGPMQRPSRTQTRSYRAAADWSQGWSSKQRRRSHRTRPFPVAEATPSTPGEPRMVVSRDYITDPRYVCPQTLQ